MSATSPPPHSIALPFAACCTGVAIFSVMDALMKGLALSLGAYNALLWRGVAGLLVGGVVMIATRASWPAWRVLRLHILRGVIVAFMAFTFFWALARLPMAEAIALTFLAPIIALLLAALMLGEKIGAPAIVASLFGFAGVGVILAGRLGASHGPDALWGVAAVLLSAVLYAWNLILQRQQAQLSSPIEIGFFQNLVILAVMACAAPWLGALPPIGAAPAIVGAATLAFISLIFLSWGYARAEAQVLIPVEYTAFIWSAIMGWLVFHERLAVTTLAGAVLIVAGCVIAARAKPGVVAHVETSAV
jgi:S-adenosylmethionine uptake transporter